MADLGPGPALENPAEEVYCTRNAHIMEQGRCRFCAKTPERIEAEIAAAPRRSAVMPDAATQVNCMTEDPQLNVQHLVVANIIEGGLMACGFVMAPGDHPSLHADKGGPAGDGICTCAPAATWPRCPDCVRAVEDSAARKAARAGLG